MPHNIPIVKKRTKHFKRHQSDRYHGVAESWRKPKGIDNRVSWCLGGCHCWLAGWLSGDMDLLWDMGERETGREAGLIEMMEGSTGNFDRSRMTWDKERRMEIGQPASHHSPRCPLRGFRRGLLLTTRSDEDSRDRPPCPRSVTDPTKRPDTSFLPATKNFSSTTLPTSNCY